jgi:hypothetical protein
MDGNAWISHQPRLDVLARTGMPISMRTPRPAPQTTCLSFCATKQQRAALPLSRRLASPLYLSYSLQLREEEHVDRFDGRKALLCAELDERGCCGVTILCVRSVALCFGLSSKQYCQEEPPLPTRRNSMQPSSWSPNLVMENHEFVFFRRPSVCSVNFVLLIFLLMWINLWYLRKSFGSFLV